MDTEKNNFVDTLKQLINFRHVLMLLKESRRYTKASKTYLSLCGCSMLSLQLLPKNVVSSLKATMSSLNFQWN